MSTWPPRVLHVGNIGNNAYQNARILEAAGVPSDVLCYDYFHLMGSPEWEDGDIPAVPPGLDESFPDWSRLDVRDFSRPRWFAQGPLWLAAAYLEAHRRGAVRAGPLWRALQASRWAVARPGLRRLAHAGLTRWRRSAAPETGQAPPAAGAAALEERFRRLFPDRTDALQARDLGGRPGAKAAALAGLFAGYDVVIGYATDAVLPLLAGHPRFLAFEHGTIRSIPFEDSAVGRLTALAFRTAECALVTNCDNIRAVRRLGLDNARYIPHPMNDRLIAAADGGALRAQLCDRYAADFIVFHPSRQHWDSGRDPSWEKANDVLIEGFARFVRAVAARALLVLVRWGRSVEATEALVRAAGVSGRVHWIPPVPNRTMLAYMKAADAVADQFFVGTFGGITPKAMGCGRPVLLHLDPGLHTWCFPELPPHVACRSAGDVVCGLTRLYQDPAQRAELGARSRAWYETYHSEAVIRDGLIEALRPRPAARTEAVG